MARARHSLILRTEGLSRGVIIGSSMAKGRTVGLLNNVIRTAVISALGAKLAKGRSPIVAALLMLLATRAFAKDESKPNSAAPTGEDGVGALIDRFPQRGLEDVIKSWIGTGPNKEINPPQLQRALGPETIDNLSQETGLPKDDLLSQLSKLLPEIIDKLTPSGKLPPGAICLRGRTIGCAKLRQHERFLFQPICRSRGSAKRGATTNSVASNAQPGGRLGDCSRANLRGVAAFDVHNRLGRRRGLTQHAAIFPFPCAAQK